VPQRGHITIAAIGGGGGGPPCGIVGKMPIGGGCWNGPGGGIPCAGKVVPQLRQNFIPGGFSAWQTGHFPGNPAMGGGVGA
jgi:hypothetical protein